ncbi:MAG: hypothetical protein GX577_07995 [Leptolinea sp.]|nr:hypothetical protein [Leptolinea sp.]
MKPSKPRAILFGFITLLTGFTLAGLTSFVYQPGPAKETTPTRYSQGLSLSLICWGFTLTTIPFRHNQIRAARYAHGTPSVCPVMLAE